MRFEVLNVSGKKWVEIDNYEDLALADAYFSQLKKSINNYKCYLFDLDGTLYVGGKPLYQAIDSVKKLQSQGKIVKFLSNNSSKSKMDYVDRLTTFGIICNEQDIVLSTDATIEFLKEHHLNRVYVLGTQKLQQIFIDEGFELTNIDAQMVVLGYDTELTYEKMMIASNLVHQGIDYIATHTDVFCPTENGPIPDIGTMIAMLEMTTQTKPLKIFGKPNIDMIRTILDKLMDVQKSDVLMVGDRLYTDILMAQNFGVDSVLVLSGDTTRDVVEGSDIKPTYILKEFSI